MRSYADYRKWAKDLHAKACQLPSNENEYAIQTLKKALSYLDFISSKNDEDIRLLILLNRALGACYFDTDLYIDAATCYNNALTSLSAISQKQDHDYRTYIFSSIDRCDAYLELAKREENRDAKNKHIDSAAQAILKGMLAFDVIQNKNEREDNLGNIWKNRKAFYKYYSKLTSYLYYLNSSHYQSLDRDQVLHDSTSSQDETTELTEMLNLLAVNELYSQTSASTAQPQQQPIPQTNMTGIPWQFYPLKPNASLPSAPVNNADDMDVDMGYKPVMPQTQ